MVHKAVLSTVFCLLLAGTGPASAQPAPQNKPQAGNEFQTEQHIRDQVNASAVGIVGGRTAPCSLVTASMDLAALFETEGAASGIRVVPVLGRGKIQNFWDVLTLDTIDLAFIQTDTLEYLSRDARAKEMAERLRTIAPMFPEEVHLITRPEIRTLEDLRGRKVNLKGSAAVVTGAVIFKRLGISFESVQEDTPVALDLMRRGEIAAHLHLSNGPPPDFFHLKGDEFHLLPIPYSSTFNGLYQPASFLHEDYPDLIPAGQSVDTLAVGNVLVTADWPETSEHYRKIARFVQTFFDRFEDLHKPEFHPKWKDVNLAATLPGWKRFKAAQGWLDRQRSPQGVSREKLNEEFDAFFRDRSLPVRRDATGSTADEEHLFRSFLDWRVAKPVERK